MQREVPDADMPERTTRSEFHIHVSLPPFPFMLQFPSQPSASGTFCCIRRSRLSPCDFLNDYHRRIDVKQPDTQAFSSKQRTRTRQQSREQPVFPFAIFITQSFRSSILTLTLTHTHTRSSHRGLGGVGLVEGMISFRSW